MVTAPGTVGVEVDRLHVVALQVMARRAVGLDGAGRGDVVGGHRVAEHRQDAGVLDRLHIVQLGGQAVEERRVLDVGGFAVPLVGFGIRNRQALPGFVAFEHARVLLLEHVVVDHHHGVLDFLAARPDVLHEHIVAVLILAERVFFQVDLDRAGQRVGDHQRR